MSDNHGLFGKIPAHGDFISRNLHSSYLTPWDEWLQRCVHGSQELIGNDWLNIYLTSPVWRFVLSPGCVDNQARAGILVPSVDSVGRYFPITLTCPIDTNSNLFLFQQNNEAWYSQLQDIAISALQNNLNADDIMEQLSALQPQQSLRQSNPLLSNGARVAPGSNTDISSSYGQMLGDIYSQNCPSHSVWWCHGSQHMGPTCLTSPGLPEPSQYSAMLAGNWNDGWQ